MSFNYSDTYDEKSGELSIVINEANKYKESLQ